jgi:hypothetical protein
MTRAATTSREQALLALAVAPSSLRVVGPYTSPPSWGVYRIEPATRSATRRYRLGNHPVRERELRAEFGRVQVVALFASRPLAVELAALYNAAPR